MADSVPEGSLRWITCSLLSTLLVRGGATVANPGSKPKHRSVLEFPIQQQSFPFEGVEARRLLFACGQTHCQMGRYWLPETPIMGSLPGKVASIPSDCAAV